MVLSAQHHIGRLDVTVNHSLGLVDVVQCSGKLQQTKRNKAVIFPIRL